MFFGRVQSTVQFHEHLSVEVKALLGIRLTSPCPMRCADVAFSNQVLLSVHGEQPIALAFAWVVWGGGVPMGTFWPKSQSEVTHFQNWRFHLEQEMSSWDFATLVTC